MNDFKAVSSRLPKSASIPRWMGPILFALVFWLTHIAVPRHLSRLTHRHGWVQDRPGRWNFLGLIGVVSGIACVIWAMLIHRAQAPEGWEWERSPKYLLQRAPYTFTRNPIYLSELALWLGWAIYYGSTVVFLAFWVTWSVFHFVVVPWEEKMLEARFGDAYREYKRNVPRWFGMIRS